MTPLERLRIEKAAVDCGFEMTPELMNGALRLRSARFPESVDVFQGGDEVFSLVASHPTLVDAPGGTRSVALQGYTQLYTALRLAAARARTLPNRVADAFRQQTAALPRATEAERLVVQRVGQDLFRAALLDYWQARCCVTGLAVPELLKASHIKAWAACDTDDERLDVFNGLLLAPHVDAMFDGGWISFSIDGSLLIADGLPVAARTQLGVNDGWHVAGLKPGHAPYLAFHRKHHLRG